MNYCICEWKNLSEDERKRFEYGELSISAPCKCNDRIKIKIGFTSMIGNHKLEINGDGNVTIPMSLLKETVDRYKGMCSINLDPTAKQIGWASIQLYQEWIKQFNKNS